MFEIVRAAKEAKVFEEDVNFYNKIEKNIHEPENVEEKKEVAPVFNKRLFASQGAVIITREARRLMAENARANENCDMDSALSKTEVQCLRCVVDGLKLIHKGQDFVKDVLSKVISYEMYRPFEYVSTKSWEDHLGCYYILNGAVEVTYDLRSTESRNVFQANIIYSHGTGEYLGLISAEEPTEDLAPPATIYTKELTQFIRIDRQRFHKLMQKAKQLIDKRKRDYISSRSFLTRVSTDVKEKILHKLSIQEYPANRLLLSQGEVTDYLFIIMSGRCQTYREAFIPEAEKEVLFYLTSRDPDDFFGEECVLDMSPSTCTIVTATATTIMKLHRTALKMVNKEKLTRFIDEQRHDVPSNENLRDRGYRDSLWNKYKHTHIKGTLKETGKLQYLSRPSTGLVRERPPDESELYLENMRRFVMTGCQFEPMRAQSADTSGSLKLHRQNRRPQTAFAGIITETVVSSGDSDNQKENEIATEKQALTRINDRRSSLITVEKAKELEQHISKVMESKENLLKVLDEPSDINNHLRQAWKADDSQESQNFMKNGVLVTMTSEDIVRKAKALADTFVDKWKDKSVGNEEDWDTVLHAENKQAKMLITANRLRIKDLKRRLAELQKRREKERHKLKPRRADYFSDDDDDDEREANAVHEEINKTRTKESEQNKTDHNESESDQIRTAIVVTKTAELKEDIAPALNELDQINSENDNLITGPDVNKNDFKDTNDAFGTRFSSLSV